MSEPCEHIQAVLDKAKEEGVVLGGTHSWAACDACNVGIENLDREYVDV